MAGSVDRARPLTICDLTQSWSPTGGGVATYLREKRDFMLRETPHRLVQIVPGPEDRVTVDGRHVFAEVGAKPVGRGSPYRFILRTGVVRRLLAEHEPDVIECLCPWVLPWTAIRHRREFPAAALVAGYRTDFPNAQVHRVAEALFGGVAARGLRALSYGYAEVMYREFDRVYALGEEARAALTRRRVTRTDLLPLGVDLDLFTPARRDPDFRAELGLPGDGPLLIYAGRLDNEKRAGELVAMMRQLPPDFGAALVMMGDGALRERLVRDAAGLPIVFRGYEGNRGDLARALASSDIYVSAMADETFGVSVLEAQAAGLPVVGVAGGAMRDRVPSDLGRLGPVGDHRALAANVVQLWRSNPAAVGRAARAHVERRYSWPQTFDRLLGHVYPQALARADRRMRAKASGERWSWAAA